ncbi:MAG: TIGR01459 family HAD-type hydrolase [Hyphomicrobiales bacterium]|nr:MAG: TIGR01459 family HAD-type hydrolase [Hyphomicrobiales bacterium]
MTPPALYAGLSALAGDYEAFLLDSWGVLQNGVAPLPGANDCLRRLNEAGKSLVILSNSARRAHVVAGELARTGVAMEHIGQVLTGGEAAWQALHGRTDAAHRALGRRCYYLGSQRSRSLLDGLDLDIVASVREASFILCTSPPDEGLGPALNEVLAEAARRGLTMVCANPDLSAHYGEEERPCAGAVARLYAALGGAVIHHGKPHQPFYDMALARLGEIAPSHVLAVGDAFATDLAGAAAAGLDGLLVMGGIHRASFAGPDGRAAQLEALCREYDLWPVGAVERFCW